MTSFDNKTALPFSTDCTSFLNWSDGRQESAEEKAIVFRSLVATLKLQPTLDVSLEAKAVKFLEYVVPNDKESAEVFLRSLGLNTDDSVTDFVQSIAILVSSPSLAIIKAAMEHLSCLIEWCSAKVLLTLVKADLIHQLMITLNPLSLSFTENGGIHAYLLKSLRNTLCLATPYGLEQVEIEDRNEQQAVHETVLKQVLAPSENYIFHLCVNRFSLADDEQSRLFMELMAHFLRISPFYQPTMDFVLKMPVVLTMPSRLTIIDFEDSIWLFLYFIGIAQQEWNEIRGNLREMSQTVHRMLRMEGNEDVIEEKLLNDKNEYLGRRIVATSIEWNNMLGMNLPQL
ncbi:hypothetical protein BLNAU_22420 [Blattamonas nauphoetae]|uniref:Uncharacterized protein n=1 Tax=Blattamonas nauphoetae TaxID=2049346 RepID=A0ABQ9WT41_9EUKA|nr:hypothetical protein BLNAU_22420 [Blattamonas nauphoetae]